MRTVTHRQFFARAGRGAGSLAIGLALAQRSGLAHALFGDDAAEPPRLRFGALEPLVDLLQATPADDLLPLLVRRLHDGTPLADLACAAARRWCELDHPHDGLFAKLLGFAVSEDGALHAEKYFRTAQEEHATARSEQRERAVIALTRVMASHAGFPAPGIAQARALLET